MKLLLLIIYNNNNNHSFHHFATMQNSPTIISIPPPFPLFPPPQPTGGQIVVIPIPPPPFRPFFGAPSSEFQITDPAPPPPFAGDSSSVDLSPLEFLLALVAIVTIPALIYTFIFAYGCSSSHRRRSSSDEVSGDPSIASELSRHDVESVSPVESAGVKYQKETHATKIGGECPVCLSVFSDGEEIRQLSVCKHSFHTSCIDLWLSNNSNCPICRATVASTAAATAKSSDSSRDGDHQQVPRDAASLV
ncbi:RING-H2 finger protein ATL33-like [Trifolium pratense]|uniref:RING-H2 finger protein ATL33-like n=1 Tax=Trifolium pratense TaxID=57577 RepID=UPI001E691E91|nr:RING-H2 finger protein ATL33-like [Trifolium pratense]